MFREKRFGMFVHWGLYAIRGWHEQEQWRYPVESKEYQAYMYRFCPKKYDPDAWVLAAKQAGMDYICFTAKHHDGFCMWDTAYSDYKVTNSPYGKDVLKELAEACHRQGMALSIYYSVPDWHHENYPNFGRSHELAEPKPGDCPDEDKYIQYVKNQVTELLSNYGPILSFFWDIPPQRRDPSVNELVRSLQPGILINNRGYDEGDFATPEREVPEGGRFETLTEACQSVGRQSWGYRSNEDYYSHRFLISSIDRIMAMGGNYVLNIGPDADGQLPPEGLETLQAVGDWYRRVKPALYAEPASNLFPGSEFLVTKKENTLYFHFPKAPEASGLFFSSVKEAPNKAVILNDGTPLSVSFDQMPTLCSPPQHCGPVLHLNGIPVNRITGETIILALEFEDVNQAVDSSCGIQKEGRF